MTRILSTALLLCWSSLLLAGVEEDYAEGAKLFHEGKVVDSLPPLKRAADGGHIGAQALFADILDSAEFDEDAVMYYRKAAEQGSADAMFGLGSMYASGEGIAQDQAQARKWITDAAKLGNKNAIMRLSHSHIRGGLGLDDATRSGPEALVWIKRAADLDDMISLEALAAAYRTGNYGLAADLPQAQSLEARIAALRKPVPKAEVPPKK